MCKEQVMSGKPGEYSRLEGSERHPAKDARLVGTVEPNERVSVTVCVRRRPDGRHLPEPEEFLIPP